MDVISDDTYLPEVDEGDLLLVLNAGAYTNAAATNFNGFDPAKIIFM
jgi:ornithine decarboxylase